MRPTFTTTTLSTLSLPAGSYYIHAKATLRSNDGSNPYQGQCDLAAGTDVDSAKYGVVSTGGTNNRDEVGLDVVHTFAAAGSVTFACEVNNQIDALFPRIVAVATNTISNTVG